MPDRDSVIAWASTPPTPAESNAVYARAWLEARPVVRPPRVTAMRRSSPRPRGAGRPAARRTRSRSRGSPDSDDPEPARPHRGRCDDCGLSLVELCWSVKDRLLLCLDCYLRRRGAKRGDRD